MMPPPAKPRVLIVDDNPANRMAFESILDKTYAVVLAENGHQALELAGRESFAVILLDVRMPGIDGFETAARLRKVPASLYTPIIFTSAYDHTAEQIKKGFVAGATDFVFSPVDDEILAFKVSTYVALHLRYETTKAQLTQLRTLVQALVDQVNARCPLDEVLKGTIQKLEEALVGLEHQIWPAST